MEDVFNSFWAWAILIIGSLALGNYIIGAWKNDTEKRQPSQYPLIVRLVGRLIVGVIVIYVVLHYFGVF